MLRGWTRRGRIKMLEELALLARHAEILASQERALRCRAEANEVSDWLGRAQPLLAELRSGGAANVTRREINLLHGLAVRQLASVERGHALRSAQGGN